MTSKDMCKSTGTNTLTWKPRVWTVRAWTELEWTERTWTDRKWIPEGSSLYEGSLLKFGDTIALRTSKQLTVAGKKLDTYISASHGLFLHRDHATLMYGNSEQPQYLYDAIPCSDASRRTKLECTSYCEDLDVTNLEKPTSADECKSFCLGDDTITEPAACVSTCSSRLGAKTLAGTEKELQEFCTTNGAIWTERKWMLRKWHSRPIGNVWDATVEDTTLPDGTAVERQYVPLANQPTNDYAGTKFRLVSVQKSMVWNPEKLVFEDGFIRAEAGQKTEPSVHNHLQFGGYREVNGDKVWDDVGLVALETRDVDMGRGSGDPGYDYTDNHFCQGCVGVDAVCSNLPRIVREQDCKSACINTKGDNMQGLTFFNCLAPNMWQSRAWFQSDNVGEGYGTYLSDGQGKESLIRTNEKQLKSSTVFRLLDAKNPQNRGYIPHGSMSVLATYRNYCTDEEHNTGAPLQDAANCHNSCSNVAIPQQLIKSECVPTCSDPTVLTQDQCRSDCSDPTRLSLATCVHDCSDGISNQEACVSGCSVAKAGKDKDACTAASGEWTERKWNTRTWNARKWTDPWENQAMNPVPTWIERAWTEHYLYAKADGTVGLTEFFDQAKFNLGILHHIPTTASPAYAFNAGPSIRNDAVTITQFETFRILNWHEIEDRSFIHRSYGQYTVASYGSQDRVDTYIVIETTQALAPKKYLYARTKGVCSDPKKSSSYTCTTQCLLPRVAVNKCPTLHLASRHWYHNLDLSTDAKGSDKKMKLFHASKRHMNIDPPGNYGLSTRTGEVVWETTDLDVGYYNAAFKVKDARGNLMGSRAEAVVDLIIRVVDDATVITSGQKVSFYVDRSQDNTPLDDPKFIADSTNKVNAFPGSPEYAVNIESGPGLVDQGGETFVIRKHSIHHPADVNGWPGTNLVITDTDLAGNPLTGNRLIEENSAEVGRVFSGDGDRIRFGDIVSLQTTREYCLVFETNKPTSISDEFTTEDSCVPANEKDEQTTLGWKSGFLGNVENGQEGRTGIFSDEKFPTTADGTQAHHIFFKIYNYVDYTDRSYVSHHKQIMLETLHRSSSCSDPTKHTAGACTSSCERVVGNNRVSVPITMNDKESCAGFIGEELEKQATWTDAVRLAFSNCIKDKCTNPTNLPVFDAADHPNGACFQDGKPVFLTREDCTNSCSDGSNLMNACSKPEFTDAATCTSKGGKWSEQCVSVCSDRTVKTKSGCVSGCSDQTPVCSELHPVTNVRSLTTLTQPQCKSVCNNDKKEDITATYSSKNTCKASCSDTTKLIEMGGKPGEACVSSCSPDITKTCAPHPYGDCGDDRCEIPNVWTARFWIQRSWTERTWGPRDEASCTEAGHGGREWITRSWTGRSWVKREWHVREYTDRNWKAGDYLQASPEKCETIDDDETRTASSHCSDPTTFSQAKCVDECIIPGEKGEADKGDSTKTNAQACVSSCFPDSTKTTQDSCRSSCDDEHPDFVKNKDKCKSSCSDTQKVCAEFLNGGGGDGVMNRLLTEETCVPFECKITGGQNGGQAGVGQNAPGINTEEQCQSSCSDPTKTTLQVCEVNCMTGPNCIADPDDPNYKQGCCEKEDEPKYLQESECKSTCNKFCKQVCKNALITKEEDCPATQKMVSIVDCPVAQRITSLADCPPDEITHRVFFDRKWTIRSWITRQWRFKKETECQPQDWKAREWVERIWTWRTWTPRVWKVRNRRAYCVSSCSDPTRTSEATCVSSCSDGTVGQQKPDCVSPATWTNRKWIRRGWDVPATMTMESIFNFCSDSSKARMEDCKSSCTVDGSADDQSIGSSQCIDTCSDTTKYCNDKSILNELGCVNECLTDPGIVEKAKCVPGCTDPTKRNRCLDALTEAETTQQVLRSDGMGPPITQEQCESLPDHVWDVECKDSCSDTCMNSMKTCVPPAKWTTREWKPRIWKERKPITRNQAECHSQCIADNAVVDLPQQLCHPSCSDATTPQKSQCVSSCDDPDVFSQGDCYALCSDTSKNNEEDCKASCSVTGPQGNVLKQAECPPDQWVNRKWKSRKWYIRRWTKREWISRKWTKREWIQRQWLKPYQRLNIIDHDAFIAPFTDATDYKSGTNAMPSVIQAPAEGAPGMATNVAYIGFPYSFDLIASDTKSQTVDIFHSDMPDKATLSAPKRNPVTNDVSYKFEWTPCSGQEGHHVFCFDFHDNADHTNKVGGDYPYSTIHSNKMVPTGKNYFSNNKGAEDSLYRPLLKTNSHDGLSNAKEFVGTLFSHTPDGTHMFADGRYFSSKQRCVDIHVIKDKKPQWIAGTDVMGRDLKVPQALVVNMGVKFEMVMTTNEPEDDTAANSFDRHVITVNGVYHKGAIVRSGPVTDTVVSKLKSNALPEGASLGKTLTVGDGKAVPFEFKSTFTWTPTREQGNWHYSICFDSTDLAGGSAACPASGVMQTTTGCIDIHVAPCKWALQDKESFIHLAKDAKTNWLQLWANNKHIKKPDFEAQPGTLLNIGMVYKAEKDDSLAAIAGKFGTTVELIMQHNVQLEKLNQPEQHVINVGESLCVIVNSCPALIQ